MLQYFSDSLLIQLWLYCIYSLFRNIWLLRDHLFQLRSITVRLLWFLLVTGTALETFTEVDFSLYLIVIIAIKITFHYWLNSRSQWNLVCQNIPQNNIIHCIWRSQCSPNFPLIHLDIILCLCPDKPVPIPCKFQYIWFSIINRTFFTRFFYIINS